MKKTNLSDYDPSQVPSGKDYTIGIVVAEWNKEITDALAQGAIDTLRKYDVAESNIHLVHVPGSFELTTGADLMLRNDKKLDADEHGPQARTARNLQPSDHQQHRAGARPCRRKTR